MASEVKKVCGNCIYLTSIVERHTLKPNCNNNGPHKFKSRPQVDYQKDKDLTTKTCLKFKPASNI